MTIQESRVLVLYTGGTIGMLRTDRGFAVQPGFLGDWLRSQTAFNDLSGNSVASNALSQSVYQKWSVEERKREVAGTSGTNTPTEFQGPLLTPVMRQRGMMKRIRYTIKEYNPLVPSPSIDHKDWLHIAQDIETQASNYDGFVILHGTDTMVYTASALAFLLQGLGKPVVITGSQIPLCEYSTDAMDNFRGALLSASLGDLSEVCIWFGRKLFRGVRTRKVSSFELDAFDSPMLEPLLKTDVEHGNQRPTSISDVRALLPSPTAAMSDHVSVLQIYPGMTVAALRRAIIHDDVKGVVMSTFGAGNFPLKDDLLAVLKEAIERDVIIINVSQCARGKVLPIYLTGVILSEIGVIAGVDMTPECAFTKLAYLLAQEHLTLAERKRWMVTNIVGEITSSVV